MPDLAAITKKIRALQARAADAASTEAEVAIAVQAIARYIDGFCNPVRRHSALDFLSPVQFQRRAVN